MNGDYFTIYARDKVDKTDGYWQLALVEEGAPTATWMTNTNYDIVGLNYYDTTNGFV